ncbi:MAG: NAD-dependent epimerase/dehydratase family protein [Phycisphaerales bacterium]|nr:NAD-dependent epimerase/dehydratase family protein [Phycisphaerales bacterium]
MNLVTGATGLLGSHIVEQLRRRDMPVRVLVRANSDRSWLRTQGVEFVEGDLNDPASLARACQGCDVVYHSAARVGDWGPWEEFQRYTIDGTRALIDAAAKAGARRFVHISSISTYGYHTKDITVDETFDLGYKMYRWAYYTRSKVEAERIAWDAHRQGRIQVTVIRPAWIYGERDRTTIARLAHIIRAGKAKILGAGTNRLNVVYAGNIAEACITAAHLEKAAGEAYNCSNDGEITQQEYFDMLADALNAPRVTQRVPYRIAYTAGFVLECVGHLFRSKKPPFITRYAVWLMGRRSFFSAEKARRELNWKATIPYERGIPNTVRWYLTEVEGQTPADSPATAPVA